VHWLFCKVAKYTDHDKYQFGFKAGHSTTLVLELLNRLLIIMYREVVMCLHVS